MEELGLDIDSCEGGKGRRGKHPEDVKIFSESEIPKLRQAVKDYSFLLSRNYAPASALKLVGDHFQLCKRQRLAVERASCSDDALSRRKNQMISNGSLDGETFLLDGFNVLITLESILAGGVILKCRDGCFRDLAGVHGSWRKVIETKKSLQQIGLFLKQYNPKEVRWFLDLPLGKSKELAKLINDCARLFEFSWKAELVMNPDKVIVASDGIVISSDSWILDNSLRWFNLFQAMLSSSFITFQYLDLS